MKSELVLAKQGDIPTIVQFMEDMQSDLKEFNFDKSIVTQAISNALKENVFWFLFLDEKQQPFGTCYLQSVHNYWRLGKRYYLGGFYIAPTHRKQGRFREIYKLLRLWATEHDGVQIYAHIHRDNKNSLQTFKAVGVEEIEYYLCRDHWGS